MIREGMVLDKKYELLRTIGEGAMGIVFEGRNLATERRVAIKVLNPGCAAKEETRQRFAREAKAAGKIDHEHICGVLDFGEFEDAHYLVMPLLKGETLADILEREGRLLVKRAVDIATQVLIALEVAHGNGIVHRDLKPENIFLTTISDREDFVKILDFGITKVNVGVQSFDDVVSGTKTGLIMGTPCYMSPEQVAACKEVDGRSDLYSLGVVLYEMLGGNLPRKPQNLRDLFVGDLWDKPIPSLRAKKAGIPQELEAVVMKSLLKERDGRYGSATEMKGALRAALEASGDDLGTKDTLDEDESYRLAGVPASCVKESLWKRVVRQSRWQILVAIMGVTSLVTLAVLGFRGGEVSSEPGETAAAIAPVANERDADLNTGDVDAQSSLLDEDTTTDSTVGSPEGVPENAYDAGNRHKVRRPQAPRVKDSGPPPPQPSDDSSITPINLPVGSFEEPTRDPESTPPRAPIKLPVDRFEGPP